MTRAGGFVYFIEAIGADAVKVGWAIDLERRLRDHQIGCPLELRIIARAPGTVSDEGSIHHHFAAHCIRGEWFKRNVELDAFIERVSSTGCLPRATFRNISLQPVEPCEGDVDIKELRRKLGISQRALAEDYLNVTQATVCRLENKLVPQVGALRLLLQKLAAETTRSSEAA